MKQQIRQKPRGIKAAIIDAQALAAESRNPVSVGDIMNLGHSYTMAGEAHWILAKETAHPGEFVARLLKGSPWCKRTIFLCAEDGPLPSQVEEYFRNEPFHGRFTEYDLDAVYHHVTLEKQANE